MLHCVQEAAARIVQLGSMETEAGRAAVHAFDDQLTAAWVSPGGSADLVAVTHFLYEIESR